MRSTGSTECSPRIAASMRSSALSSIVVSAFRLRRAYSARNQRPARRLHDGRFDRLVVGLADRRGYGKIGHCPSDCGKTDATNTARIVAISLMAQGNPTIVNDSFAGRLALVYAAFFLIVGWHLPLFPVWLTARGLDPAAIGFVLAAMQAVRVIANAGRNAHRRPLWIVARGDHHHSRSDRCGDRAARQRNRLHLHPHRGGHGRVCLSAGPAADRRLRSQRAGAARQELWAGAHVGLGCVHCGEPDRRRAAQCARARKPDLGDLSRATVRSRSPHCCCRRCRATARRAARGSHSHLRQPAFLAIAAAASLIQASHAVYYGFSTLDWTAKGFDGVTIGVLWALGVVAEIVLFAFAGRLPRSIGPVTPHPDRRGGRHCALGRDDLRSAGSRCCFRCSCCTRFRSARRISAP